VLASLAEGAQAGIGQGTVDAERGRHGRGTGQQVRTEEVELHREAIAGTVGEAMSRTMVQSPESGY